MKTRRRGIARWFIKGMTIMNISKKDNLNFEIADEEEVEEVNKK